MAEHAQDQDPAAYRRFLTLFRTSVVGVVMSGTPVPDEHGRPTSDGTLGVSRTDYGDGRQRLLTFADPEAFARNFGPQFNAGLAGDVLLRMAADDPDCEGILVNSATRPSSVVISKSTAAEMAHPE